MPLLATILEIALLVQQLLMQSPFCSSLFFNPEPDAFFILVCAFMLD